MSDINASIQPENVAQQGDTAPVSAEVGTTAMGESASPIAGVTTTAEFATEQSAPVPAQGGESPNAAPAADAGAHAAGDAPAAGGDAIAAQAEFAAATLPSALVDTAPDVSGSIVTPIDGTAPATVDEKSHPVHNVLVRIELLAENLPNEFMNALKRLVVEGRDELRKIL